MSGALQFKGVHDHVIALKGSSDIRITGTSAAPCVHEMPLNFRCKPCVCVHGLLPVCRRDGAVMLVSVACAKQRCALGVAAR